jgi:hypothetical protein
MPVFSSDSLEEGLVFPGATGVFQASDGDIVSCTHDTVVTLPQIVGVLPAVQVQPQAANFVGASGATGALAYPTSPPLDSVVVTVVGATGAPSVVTADGSEIDGVNGATGVSVTAGSSRTVVSKAGNWYTV